MAGLLGHEEATRTEEVCELSNFECFVNLNLD